MLWVDKAVEEIKKARAADLETDELLIVRDEKTASGRVHVGSMRGVGIHGAAAEALAEAGVPVLFMYEINDFDPMDGLPAYLDQAAYEPYMGKPLNAVPSPEPGFDNYAEYFGQEFEQVIRDTGYDPTFYRASELYVQGKLNGVIAQALDKAELIRQIYKEVSGAERPDDWYPINVICEQCGKVGTTRATGWDGQYVTYRCEPEMVAWAKGCGHTGRTTPFDGRAKLPWKVEWPAKWRTLNVAVEGAGKDHSTKGGSRQVAERISREVFDFFPPYDIPYEFFLVGGQKMSSSKGRGASAREIADLLPPVLFRLLLSGTQPMRAINFDPAGETLPMLFDWYDRIAQKSWAGEADDDARLFSLIHHGQPPEAHFLARFQTVAFLVQMPHVDMREEFAALKGAPLTELEQGAIEERAKYARQWLEEYAPERYRFEVQETLPEAAKGISAEQKAALGAIAAYLTAHPEATGEELHAALHEIRKESDLPAKEFFGPVYLAILGKESGPQAGWFLTNLDRTFLLDRLHEASA
ncbi:MAG TPA: lysine--tRNA ligase [Candidatus Paceibacterota bacterium]|nr:lysine--tRNA ligase [Candidatus Paceibacterota bacterium]